MPGTRLSACCGRSWLHVLHPAPTPAVATNSTNSFMQSETLTDVYEDRNALALALGQAAETIRAARSGWPRRPLPPSTTEVYAAAWQPDHGDDADADEWAILYVNLPDGQASWHVPRDVVERSGLSRFPPDADPWDGHDRTEKNRRLRSFAGE